MFSEKEIAFSRDWIKVIYDLKKSLDIWAFDNLQDLWDNQFNPSYMQFLLLIDDQGKSNNELAKSSGISKQAMSKIILKLVEMDLIISTRSSADRRLVNLTLTDKGKRVVSQSLIRFAQLISEYKKQVGSQDLEISQHTLSIARVFINQFR